MPSAQQISSVRVESAKCRRRRRASPPASADAGWVARLASFSAQVGELSARNFIGKFTPYDSSACKGGRGILLARRKIGRLPMPMPAQIISAYAGNWWARALPAVTGRQRVWQQLAPMTLFSTASTTTLRLKTSQRQPLYCILGHYSLTMSSQVSFSPLDDRLKSAS